MAGLKGLTLFNWNIFLMVPKIAILAGFFYVLCAYCNFESKQAILISLFRRHPNNKKIHAIFIQGNNSRRFFICSFRNLRKLLLKLTFILP